MQMLEVTPIHTAWKPQIFLFRSLPTMFLEALGAQRFIQPVKRLLHKDV